MQLPLLAALCLVLTASAQAATTEDIYATPTLQDDLLHAAPQDEAAIEAARQRVEQLRATADDSPRLLANALTRLGDALLSTDDIPAASAAYVEALEVLEANVSLVDPAQLEPLRGLGLALARSQQHELAVPHLERAVMISHRAHGVLAPSQQGLLHQLASSLWYSGRAADAHKQLQYLQRVGEHAYGRDDPRMARVFNVIGTWHVDSGNFLTGRDNYRRAMQVIERGPGQRDPALIEPLRLLARSFTQELYLVSQGLRPPASEPVDMWDEPQLPSPRRLDPLGERALLGALALLDTQQEPDSRTLLHTLVQTGDWFMIDRQPDKALPYYQRAAQTLPKLPAPAEGPALLSAPVRLYYPLPTSALRHRQLADDRVEEKVVTVSFTVTATGEVKDERVIESTGSVRQQNETLTALRAARYRPRMVDGQAVDTTDVVERQVFRLRRGAGSGEQPAEEAT